MKEFVEATKIAAYNMMAAKKLTDLIQGRVVSISPLQIYIDQKMTIGEKQVVLTDAVKDHDVDITIKGISDSRGDSISGTTTITIHNALQIGEAVLMIRKQGGQQFLIIGRGEMS